jgi:uncharacterized protein (TIGR02246 family)
MKRQTVFLIIMMILLILCSTCQTGSTESDLQAITKLVTDDYDMAFNTGDADARASLYADDAVMMPPNEPLIRSKEAIRAYEAQDDSLDLQLTDTATDVQVFGNWGFVQGTYTVTTAQELGGESILENGKFVVIVKRIHDGSWKIAHDIWNSDSVVESMP